MHDSRDWTKIQFERENRKNYSAKKERETDQNYTAKEEGQCERKRYIQEERQNNDVHSKQPESQYSLESDAVGQSGDS